MGGPADLGRAALEFVLRAAEPLQAAATSPESALALIELTEWDLGVVAGLGPAELTTAADAAASAVTAIRAAITAAEGDGLDLVALAQAMARLGGAIAELTSFGAAWTPPSDLPANLPGLFLE